MFKVHAVNDVVFPLGFSFQNISCLRFITNAKSGAKKFIKFQNISCLRFIIFKDNISEILL